MFTLCSSSEEAKLPAETSHIAQWTAAAASSGAGAKIGNLRGSRRIIILIPAATELTGFSWYVCNTLSRNFPDIRCMNVRLHVHNKGSNKCKQVY